METEQKDAQPGWHLEEDSGFSGPYDMYELPGFLEAREHTRKNINESEKYRRLLGERLSTWEESFFARHPKLKGQKFAQEMTVEDLFESAVRSLTSIEVEGEVIHLDVPFLLKRRPGDPLYGEGIEDLIEKFKREDYKGVDAQLKKAISIMDTAAFSAKHNIHLGFVPLYVMREEALTLSSNCRWLSKLTRK